MACKVISVVLTWSGLADTLACLESLAGLSYAGEHHTILVDNASTDGTVQAVRARFPEVHIIVNPRNLGYAAGCNVGMRAALAAGADAVWLLNNDVTVHPGSLGEIARLLNTIPGAGIVGPRIHTPGGADELGAWWDLERGRIIPAFAKDAGGKGWLGVDYVWGCAMLIAARVLREVGLFDERYVAYFEDADLCRRAGQAGYTVIAAPNARVWHGGSRAADRRPLWQLRRRAMSRLRFFWRHSPARRRPAVVARTVLYEWPLLAAGMFANLSVGARADCSQSDVVPSPTQEFTHVKKSNQSQITLTPIGTVKSPFTEIGTIKYRRTVEAEIHIEESLVDGLHGIEQNSHLVVIFYLHKSNFDPASNMMQHPRGQTELPRRGVFALRSNYRPNPIGLTTVELLSVEGNVLRVRGLDALDGTPVLDVKPFVPSIDYPEDITLPAWMEQLRSEAND